MVPETRGDPAPRLGRHITVETPEHVVLELELAGSGSRAAAALYDAVIVAALFLLLMMAIGFARVLDQWTGAWLVAFWIAVGFAVLWGYFVLYEGLAGGRTPGKRRVGIRVVMETGHPLTFGAAAIRNLVRLVDAQPGITYGVGAVLVFLHPTHKRLGDLVAGTVVVRDRTDEIGLGSPSGTAATAHDLEAGPPELSDEEFRLLEQFIARLDELTPAIRGRLLHQLVDRFAPRFPARGRAPEAFLAGVHADESARRRGRFAAKGGGVGRTTVTAERFVARKREAWEAFRAAAARAERRGLTALGGEEVIAFAARYREIAADLARARTYGLDPRVLGYLERVVGAGHNALYGLRTRRVSPRGLLLGELPAAVVRARAYVLAAAVLFTAPALAGYLLVRQRPSVAYEVLPDEMIARAELGDRHQAAGRGYAQAPSPYLPLVASGIVANNVQVAFGAFALGVTAGVGTLAVLGFNGLFFGAVLGLFANYGLAAWLLTFVAAHGVLELTAIFIAGGAGLLIGHAVLAPGDLTRRDALLVHGRTAIRMVGAAIFLLVPAGVIEGFLSASGAPVGVKLAVSGMSAMLVALYLAVGRAGLPPPKRGERLDER